jgi:hypothetical protein
MSRVARVALVAALAAALAGCPGGDCRRTVHVELDFDGNAALANHLIITLGGIGHSFDKQSGSTRETLDIQLSPSFVGQPLPMTVEALQGSVVVGSIDAMLPTNDTSCPVHAVHIVGDAGGDGGGGGGDMSQLCAPSCGSGTCGGSCAAGACSFPTSACTVCSHGVQQPGTCSTGSCATGGGAPTQCLDGMCALESCATISYGNGAVAAGKGFTCAILNPGFSGEYGVRCWGKNVGGVLGVNPANLAQSYVPLWVAGSEHMTNLVAGDDFVCGFNGNNVVCWGADDQGQLGRGKTDTIPHWVPQPVMALPMLSSQVVPLLGAGGQHACAAISSAIYCWGKNGNGELGTLPPVAPTPTMSVLTGPTVTDLALGQHHMCFSEHTTAGAYDVRCMGASDFGQVGVADSNNHPSPVVVPGLTTSVRLAAGGDSTCAAMPLTQGDLRCWGSNLHGQLGGGVAPGIYSATPVTVCTGGCNFLNAFAVGFDFACLASDDGVRCWGDGANMQLGFGNSDTSAPGQAALPNKSAWVFSGYDQTCASYGDLNMVALRCWGNNAMLQLAQPASVATSGAVAPRWGD